MDKDFLLETDVAKKLFHDHAAKMPILDYHCHLNPQAIYEDKHFKNITEIMLGGDHYKWRAMRSNGISEEYTTGNKSDFEKFEALAETLPYAIGNPLYHWTHLELRRYFGIDTILNKKTAREIYDAANKIIASDDFSVRTLIEKSNVKIICTTDDPIDSLEYHLKMKDIKAFRVLPAFRPDKAILCEKEPFIPYIKALADCTNMQISDIEDLQAALVARIDFFHSVGCRLSDHALPSVPYSPCDTEEANRIFKMALGGETLSALEIEKYKTFILLFLAKEYHARGWAMQLHIGSLLNNNIRMFKKLGPDTGFDSINDRCIAEPLAKLLGAADADDTLPKTILYTLNPKDNYVLGTMLGNFQGTEAPSKIQFGSGWWFNDQRDGMEAQMKALANLGLLGRFVGMLTDSRSFLSYSRHEYFRRILCNLIGQWVENGEYPEDYETLGMLVEGISYNNAENYFKF